MNRDKQTDFTEGWEKRKEEKKRHIEEMANDLAKICPDLVENCCGQVNCVTHLTLSLSKMGYRKASDIENSICAAIEKDFSLAIKRLSKAKLNVIGDMRIYADGKLSAYKSILSDLPRIIGLYKESEGADDEN